ncbi:NAD-dependent succinate-semialdehyde dehydrogenase [Gordonia rubripertincta]|uniref:NAD-dependent succinate-semialdehyde dehydrogenase n=1 Tax=Gordonia rubripertincta TaxID=36822 RepID=UPI00117F83E6|nr:NAD-dependent succinate-semialdehyde dehydrogenase [Gordonia rubripertincta]TSD94560.1 NAD-dependent succinate-semialdehyde dehydrogenase [Gordonia rubripertincta]
MTDLRVPALTLRSELWIGGRNVPSSDGGLFPVYDPADGTLLAEVADATPDDGRRALDAAAAAQPGWAATSPRTRAEILRRAWESIQERRNEVAAVITAEMGKPLSESLGEVTYGGEFLRWFAEEAVRINGRYTTSPSGAGQILVTREPVGPTLAITPWNFPLAMGTRKIAPALAAGCTMIVKPAPETPLTMLLLAEIFTEAGLPAGVLSVLPTSDAAALTGPLLDDPRLAKITFTGSTGTGKLLLRAAADNVLRSSMELGGNAPLIVFDDADISAAVDGALAAKMRNGGQACVAANRIYVDNKVREQFTAELTDRMRDLTVGRGSAEGTDVGPLINERQRGVVAELVDDAVAKGARLLLGGRSVDGPGFFYEPTVLADIPADARLVTEEVFGPVAAIIGFDDEDEAVAAANATRYGLAAYVFTEGLDRAMRVSRAIQAGMVGVNRGIMSDVAAPFGGYKESGLGRESGSEGIEEYLETKYIALR